MKTCDLCKTNSGNQLHGYTICESCKISLRLFRPKTVNAYAQKFGAEEYKKKRESINSEREDYSI